MSIGGAPRAMSIAGRSYTFTADSDVQVKRGGVTNTMEPNADGSVRQIQAIELPAVTGGNLNIDHAKGDQEFLQQIAALDGMQDFTLTYPSGLVLQGAMQIEGEIQDSSQSASLPISLKGEGKLTSQ